MKKLCMICVLLCALSSLLPAQIIYDAPGPHVIWNGDTLKTGGTKISGLFHTGHFAYMGIWLKSTNPADSTKYRVSFKGAFASTDTFAIPSDTLGAESNSTIMRVSDTLWHYCSVQVACAVYTKMYLTALTGHGDRCRVWFKVFLWRPDYWVDFKPIE